MYSLKKKKPLNYQELLEFYKEEAIYIFYLGDSFCVNRFIKSPFPDREDSTPSFKLRYKNNMLIWHDFGDPKSASFTKSIVGFVMRYFIDEKLTYSQAMERIMSDMEGFSVKDGILKELEQIRAKSYKVPTKGITIRKEMQEFERAVWDKLGVSPGILDRYDTKGVSEVFIDGKLWRKASKYDPIFAYILNREADDYSFQVYRPLSEDKLTKFRDHNVEGYLFGLKQLPEKGEVLIITKSCKDVLVLASRGYHAICPFSEASYVHLLSILPSLFNRFQRVYIMYDPDPAGIGYANKVIEEFDGALQNIHIPDHFQKDPADNVIAGLEKQFFEFLKEETRK